ncbi:hypothetical protein [Streptomyces sp. NPDC020298]|uniref:hypothetical protein n=1 Tax=unclassified Streptomyces TaxID=2593676 RepID=UPI0033E2A2E0
MASTATDHAGTGLEERGLADGDLLHAHEGKPEGSFLHRLPAETWHAQAALGEGVEVAGSAGDDDRAPTHAISNVKVMRSRRWTVDPLGSVTCSR